MKLKFKTFINAHPGTFMIDAFLFLLGVSFLFPVVWILLLSVKESSEIYNNPFGLPRIWMFKNYGDVFHTFNLPKYFSNSLIYAVGTVLVTIMAGAMLSYCIARMKWRLRTAVLNYMALGMIIPVQVVIIPMFLLLKQLHLRNTYFGIIFPYTAFSLPICVLMFYAFFRTLPFELEESAVIDGCSIYRCFLVIALPMVKPALAMQAVLIFINSWNEFFMAYMLVDKEELIPLTIGMLNFFVGYGLNQWGLIGASMVIASIPTILVYLFFNKQVENALTAGAILK